MTSCVIMPLKKKGKEGRHKRKRGEGGGKTSRGSAYSINP